MFEPEARLRYLATLADSEQFCTTHGAGALRCRPTVFQGNRLRVVDLPLGPALEAIGLHRLTSLRLEHAVLSGSAQSARHTVHQTHEVTRQSSDDGAIARTYTVATFVSIQKGVNMTSRSKGPRLCSTARRVTESKTPSRPPSPRRRPDLDASAPEWCRKRSPR